MIRSAAVAGMFYPEKSEEIEVLLNKYFDQVEQAEKKPILKKIKGVIVPHAGYVFSGQTAAYAYAELKKLDQSKEYTVVLIGPSHHAYLDVSVGIYDAYATPLGEVEVNKKMCGEIMERNHWQFFPDAHKQEHCLEVQLPFLQKSLKKFSIVPILCGLINPDLIAEALIPYLQKEDVVFVVSSDLSHFLEYSKAKQVDRNSLQKIVDLEIIDEREIDACGRVGIKALMRLAKKQNYQIQLLEYQNSGDTEGDKFSVVGYASLAFYKN